uniref:Uncharacterized protein n=1 Tax=Anas zonorhyncha TaxID=75864 RepID=A0A8B9V182_9AVES
SQESKASLVTSPGLIYQQLPRDPGPGTLSPRCPHPQVYESGSNVDQFVTRFLLKETANQTQSLLSSVESAVDAIDEQTNPARSSEPSSSASPWYDSPVPSYAPPARMVPRDHGKGSPSDPKEDGLEGQISRLAALIGRLEDKVRAWHQNLTKISIVPHLPGCRLSLLVSLMPPAPGWGCPELLMPSGQVVAQS